MTEDTQKIEPQDIADFEAVCQAKERELRVFQKAGGAVRYIKKLIQHQSELEKKISELVFRQSMLQGQLDALEDDCNKSLKRSAEIIAGAKDQAAKLIADAETLIRSKVLKADEMIADMKKAVYAEINDASNKAHAELDKVKKDIADNKSAHDDALKAASELADVEARLSARKAELADIEGVLKAVRK